MCQVWPARSYVSVCSHTRWPRTPAYTSTVWLMNSMRSLLARIGKFLMREYYVGGEAFHRRYAFVGATLFGLACLVLIAAVLATGPTDRFQESLMSCMFLAVLATGMLSLGAMISGFCWKGAWQGGVSLGIAILGLSAVVAWAFLRVLGWPPGMIMWSQAFRLLIVASWTINNIWCVFALLEGGSS